MASNNNVGSGIATRGGYGAFSGDRGLSGPGDRLQREMIEVSHAIERTRTETLGRSSRYVDLGDAFNGAEAIEISDGFFQLASMSGATTISLTNNQESTAGQLFLELNTNGYAVTWDTSIFWLPSGTTPDTSASHSYLFHFILMDSVWWGQLLGYRS